MWDIVYQQNVYRQTYKTVYWPTGRDGSGCDLDSYEALKWLRYCNTSKFYSRGEIKQMMEGLM